MHSDAVTNTDTNADADTDAGADNDNDNDAAADADADGDATLSFPELPKVFFRWLSYRRFLDWSKCKNSYPNETPLISLWVMQQYNFKAILAVAV